MGSFLELVVETVRGQAQSTEDALFAAGAVAVTLQDAADSPVLEPGPGETPLWPSLRAVGLFDGATNRQAALQSVATTLGLDPRRIEVREIADRPWEREWLRDFHPMRFGRRLWICPGGQRVDEPEAVLLELDPGLAFGTGTHPTTALCLEWLDAAHLPGSSVLDYGCGSGILALAALRLGARHATAVDNDPQALLATHENAARNGLAGRIDVLPPAELPDTPCDIVLANILAGPLIELAPCIAARALPGATVVLAGLLDEQAEAVAAAYRPWFDIGVWARRAGWTALSGSRLADRN
jgi:ribosomal protein L11 methyltransferase